MSTSANKDCDGWQNSCADKDDLQRYDVERDISLSGH